MSFLKRFGAGLACGFLSAPILGYTGAALCKSNNISADGLVNHTFDDVALPTKEELEYVKTWGVRWVDDWDRPTMRGMKLPDRASSSNRRQIILIRHGQYENEHSHDDSIRKLTKLGVQQAEMTGVYLAQLFATAKEHEQLKQSRRDAERALKKELAQSPTTPVDGKSDKTNPSDSPQIVALRELVNARKSEERSFGDFLVANEPRYVHVSDMTRAKETASAILLAFPPEMKKRLIVDQQLRERYPCDPQPPLTGREAIAADMKAAEDVFERYFHRPAAGEENTVEVIVGHANVIRYLTMRALQLPPEAWLRSSLPHCSVTSVVINGHGRVKLSSMGSFGHLPPNMVTVSNIG